MSQSIETQESSSPNFESLHYSGAEATSWVDKVRLIWRERRFITRVTIAAMACALLLAFLIPVQYQSTAKLMPPDSQQSGVAAAIAAIGGGALSGGGLTAGLGDLLGSRGSGATFIGILQSRTVADRLVDKFQLQKEYGVRRPEDARKILAAKTNISEERKSGIITITVTNHDPHKATQMAQAYVDELDRLVATLSTSAARRQREFLETRLELVKKELEESQVAFSQFSSKNTTIDIKEQGRAMVEAGAALQGQLIAAETELQSLRQVYSDNNVRVRAVEARISEYRRQLEKFGGNPETDSDDPTALYPSLRKLPLLGVQYADLYRRTKTAEVVYELLTRQYELSRIEEAKEIPVVKELDVPVVPQRKSFPPRAAIGLLGMMLGFFFANAWVVGREMWRSMDRDDARKVLIQEMFDSAKLTWQSARRVREYRVIRQFKKRVPASRESS